MVSDSNRRHFFDHRLGFELGTPYMLAGGAGPLAAPGVVAGAMADIDIKTANAWRPRHASVFWGGIGLSLFCAIAGCRL